MLTIASGENEKADARTSASEQERTLRIITRQADADLAHASHLSGALQQIMDARFQTPFTTLASLSLVCESIANALSDAQHIQTGAEPRKLSEQLPAQSAHFRSLAEQAIRTLDPGCYDESIAYTVNEMVNGQFQRHMTTDELVRETLSVFLSHWSRPLAVAEPTPIWPAGKCGYCGGVCEQVGLDLTCDSCGRTVVTR